MSKTTNGSEVFGPLQDSTKLVVMSDNVINDFETYFADKKADNIAFLISSSLKISSDQLGGFIRDLRSTGVVKGNIFDFSISSSEDQRNNIIRIASDLRNKKIDCIIAVGGGSVIDLAKMVCFCLRYNVYSKEEMQCYAKFSDGSMGSRFGNKSLSGKPENNKLKVTKNNATIISIPTTLSGASYSNTASIFDKVMKKKEGYRDTLFYPQAIFYSPKLASFTPEWLWFSTAIRAMDHAVEGLCSIQKKSHLDAQFLQALRLFSTALPTLKRNYSDDHARSLTQQAERFACSELGQVPHGASHGIGYVLTEMFEVPHGFTSCVLLPAVMHWNKIVNHKQHVKISEALGNPGSSAAVLIKNLIKDLELPHSLRDVVRCDLTDKILLDIAERAFAHPVTRRNPRQIKNPHDVLEILNSTL